MATTTKPEATKTITSRFDTTNVAGLTVSPQEIYEQAITVCGIKPATDIAADFAMNTDEHARISARYARGYAPPLRSAAEIGCSEGLAAYARKHPAKQHHKRVDPVELGHRFFLATDNDAVAVEDAISRAQHDDPAARATLLRLQRRIKRRAAAYRRDGGPTSIGSRRLIQAAVAAVAAFDNSDVRALVEARIAASDAREKLTKEAFGR